jgi:Family of unknown function (DUF6114)
MTADDAGTGSIAGSGPVAAGPAPRHRRARMRQWQAWRRSRPFWGGLLLVLSGLELFALPLSGVLVHGAIKLVIYIGIGGVFGVLIGVLLIVAGLVTWFNPVHKTFYSIAGIVLGIVSFPASNLGGLFLGMLLAIIGGAIAFAWTPAEPALAAEPRSEAALS